MVVALNSLLNAQTERRVALVIGNANYQQGKLNNTLRDAAGMSDTLRKLGFDVVSATDATRDEMLRAITTFGEKLAAADVGLFYFSGHGLQSKGVNYLVPLGANLQSPEEVEVEMVNANRVLVKMDAAATDVNLVILDCCRNDPFARSFRDSGGTGLAALDAPKGTMIAYATAPGTVASDGAPGGFGLYTGHLLAEMKKPNLTIERMFKNVRLGVTGKVAQQVPWESSSLTGEFFFAKSGTSTAEIPTSQKTPSSLPLGTYEGTVTFNYPNQARVISKRTIEVTADSTALNLRSTDYYESNKKKKYASQVVLKGQAQGTSFYSQNQEAISTDYGKWADENLRVEFAADGRSAILTATFRDKGSIVVGSGLLQRK